MTLPFVEQDIRDAFGPVTFQRGTGYAAQGSVRELEIAADGRRLWAQVRGSARRPYRVQVTIAEGRGRRIVSYCTCPVGGQCKHGVALMMAALRAAGRTTHRSPRPARRRRRHRRRTRWPGRSATGWRASPKRSAPLRCPPARRSSRCSTSWTREPSASGRSWR